ncbi:hypothetical protein [Flavicella sp.]|uniref:hypothetical protein n=1 Tax=Flavicella sp. TaxID=2957742 RepID=UPI003016EAF9
MIKNTPFSLLTIVVASTFSACDLSYFENDIDGLSANDISIIAPLGEATYRLSELFIELGSNNFGENDKEKLSFFYTESLTGGNNDAFDVAINNVTISSTVATPITDTDILPATFPYTISGGVPAAIQGRTQNNQVVYNLELNQELTGASLSAGTMVITFTSTFDATVTLQMEIPSFSSKDNSTAYSGSITLDGTESKDLLINLNEYNADFSHNGVSFNSTYNNIVLNMDISFTFAEGNKLRADDQVSYDAKLINTNTDVIYGDFKDEVFEISGQTMSLDAFETFGDGDIDFSNATMTLTATNDYGFPIGLDLSNIIAIGNDGTEVKLTNTIIDDVNLENYIIINGRSSFNDSEKVTSITLDESNSNFSDLLKSKPSEIILEVSGKANPIDKIPNNNFYVSGNNGLHIELKVSFDNVKFNAKDIEFNLGDDLDYFNEIELKALTVNNIPLSGTINLNFVKNGIDLNLTKSIDAFDAAQVDALGNSTGSIITHSILYFSTDEIERLKEATDIQMDITFNSHEGNSVILKGADTIQVILSVDVSIDTKSLLNDDNN